MFVGSTQGRGVPCCRPSWEPDLRFPLYHPELLSSDPTSFILLALSPPSQSLREPGQTTHPDLPTGVTLVAFGCIDVAKRRSRDRRSKSVFAAPPNF